MAMAAEPPELQPIVARPSRSLVSLTLYRFSTSGSTSFSTNSAYRPDIVSYSSPRWLPWASPLPCRWTPQSSPGPFLGDQIVERCGQCATNLARRAHRLDQELGLLAFQEFQDHRALQSSVPRR